MIYIYAVQTTAVTAEQEYRSDFGMSSIQGSRYGSLNLPTWMMASKFVLKLQWKDLRVIMNSAEMVSAESLISSQPSFFRDIC